MYENGRFERDMGFKSLQTLDNVSHTICSGYQITEIELKKCRLEVVKYTWLDKDAEAKVYIYI